MNRERLQVVDFSTPHMIEKYLMVMKKPKQTHTSTFFYMEPFDKLVWFCIVLAIIRKYCDNVCIIYL